MRTTNLLPVFAVLVFAGCAHGSDGAYQAEAVANASIGAGYRAVKAHARVETDAIKALAPTDPDAAQKRLDAEKKLTATAFKVLDTASEVVDVQDAAIVAAEAAKAKDYGAIITKLVQAGASVIEGLRVLGVKLPGGL
jgi:hypothetical protein